MPRQSAILEFEDNRLPARFWEKLTPEPNTGCWLWLGACTAAGYGQIRMNGKAVYTHRLAYETSKGKIPKGKAIDHLCRVPCCANPAHLEVVTHGENQRRGLKGRLKTQCKRGHPWIPENIYTNPTTGLRHCKLCKPINWQRWKHQHAEAKRDT